MRSFDLTRFTTAQSDTYEAALQEIRAEKKRTHWMWFIFPQIVGLGSSEMAKYYAIGDIDEANAYLTHPILGARLKEITEAMNVAIHSDPASILGATDAAKFQSCMTLFGRIAGDKTCFRHAIDKFFGGQADELTLKRFTDWQKDTKY